MARLTDFHRQHSPSKHFGAYTNKKTKGEKESVARDGSGLGLERISADFGYVGCGFGSDFHPRVRGLDIRNTVGLGRILHFNHRYPLELRKIDPNKPT
jgi:hypothetical protein